MTIDELLIEIQQQLVKEYDEDGDPILCKQYAWWILESILKTSRVKLIAQKSIALTDKQNAQLHDWLHKLIHEKMPLDYLIGTVQFDSVNILVEPPILIPRYETEEWTIYIINLLKKLNNAKLSILDMCTGSGCIAIALAKAFPNAQIWAVDIADEAIKCTEKNIAHNRVENVKVVQSNLFSNLSDDLQFDLIVSNPPYISAQEWQELDEQVKNWEDVRALKANDDGLALLKKIIEQAPAYLKKNKEMDDLGVPQLALEIGYQQGETVKSFMLSKGYSAVEIWKDLGEKDRVVVGRIS